MGLSISNSAAQRQRMQQNQQKQKRICSKSENKSEIPALPTTKNTHLHTQSALAERNSNSLQNNEETSGQKKEPKWKERYGVNLNNYEEKNREQMPKIIVNPPPKPIPNFTKEKTPQKHINAANPVQDEVKTNFLATKSIKKAVQQVHVTPVEQKIQKSGKQYYEDTPSKLGVQKLTQKMTPQRSNRVSDHSEIKNSGSKTFNFKKELPNINQSSSSLLEHCMLDVQFQNFDWAIPRTKIDQEINEGKKFKPEASVVLISKFGKQEQIVQQSSQKKKWKTRRDLMKQIVNDRLSTADQFSLPQCTPIGKHFSSIQNICS